MRKRNCVICDIDGVLFDSRKWEEEVPKGKDREEWDNFEKKVYLCTPNKPFIDLIATVNKLIPVVFITGREESPFLFKETKKQIVKNSNFKLIPNINCYLFMRKYKDYRDVEVTKEEIAKKVMTRYNPIIAIDDDERNIKVYDKLKIPTLLYSKFAK